MGQTCARGRAGVLDISSRYFEAIKCLLCLQLQTHTFPVTAHCEQWTYFSSVCTVLLQACPKGLAADRYSFVIPGIMCNLNTAA